MAQFGRAVGEAVGEALEDLGTAIGRLGYASSQASRTIESFNALADESRGTASRPADPRVGQGTRMGGQRRIRASVASRR